MDSVDTHKNEAQEKTPKINFVQRFFRKLIGYQEPTSYEEILEVITEVVQEELCNVEPEIDYDELSYHIDHSSIADYVDDYTLAGEMEQRISLADVAEYIDVDYHQIIGNLDYEDLSSYILDEDLKTGIEKLEKELLTIQNLFDGFYQSLSKIVKEH